YQAAGWYSTALTERGQPLRVACGPVQSREDYGSHLLRGGWEKVQTPSNRDGGLCRVKGGRPLSKSLLEWRWNNRFVCGAWLLPRRLPHVAILVFLAAAARAGVVAAHTLAAVADRF